MSPELKAKWVEALRSGEFKQSQGALVDRAGYCCLGVLGRVCGRSDEQLMEVRGTVNPDTIGVPTGELFFEQAATLARLNDAGDMGSGPYTFPEIADWIEKNL